MFSFNISNLNVDFYHIFKRVVDERLKEVTMLLTKLEEITNSTILSPEGTNFSKFPDVPNLDIEPTENYESKSKRLFELINDDLNLLIQSPQQPLYKKTIAELISKVRNGKNINKKYYNYAEHPEQMQKYIVEAIKKPENIRIFM